MGAGRSLGNPMTESSEIIPPPNPAPSNSSFYQFLALFILLVVVMVVFALLYQHGLIPQFLSPATPTRTLTLAVTSPSESTSSSYLSLEETLTAAPLLQTQLAQTPTEELLPDETSTIETPLEETPSITEIPTPTIPPAPSLTPAFGSCQYTLTAGPQDFLFAIYLNWGIKQNIPVVNDYYAGIYCAALLSNLDCNYQASNPNITQPGWILVLPGVPAGTCSARGGTPLP
jgi:hypothetical protein